MILHQNEQVIRFMKERARKELATYNKKCPSAVPETCEWLMQSHPPQSPRLSWLGVTACATAPCAGEPSSLPRERLAGALMIRPTITHANHSGVKNSVCCKIALGRSRQRDSVGVPTAKSQVKRLMTSEIALAPGRLTLKVASILLCMLLSQYFSKIVSLP